MPQVVTKGLHAFLLSGLNNNRPLVLVGTAQQVLSALQNVNTQLPGTDLNTYKIYFFVPSKENSVFKRETRTIAIVTTTPVTFMVCDA